MGQVIGALAAVSDEASDMQRLYAGWGRPAQKVVNGDIICRGIQ